MRHLTGFTLATLVLLSSPLAAQQQTGAPTTVKRAAAAAKATKVAGVVTEEFSGSTTIKTANVIDNVKVRHLSMGPGLCDVETRSSMEGIISTLAPLGTWSGWQVLQSVTAPISLTITATKKCDTGIRSQVQYSK